MQETRLIFSWLFETEHSARAEYRVRHTCIKVTSYLSFISYRATAVTSLSSSATTVNTLSCRTYSSDVLSDG